MSEKIRWGILSTGKIARSFAEGLTFVPDAELVAVGSRAMDTARAFASEFNIPHAHPSYEALAKDPDVDVIYIATPHPLHHDNCLLCFDAGKAVLCEKPFTINAAETEGVIAAARRQGRFLMEAMWTRYIPLVVRLRQMLAEKVIGELQLFSCGLGFLPHDLPPTHYMLKPELGGGILLDAGIYPVSLASMIFGSQPTTVAGLAEFAGGVDMQDVLALGYAGGAQASIVASIKTTIPPEFTIYGSEGRIHIHPPLFRPTRLTLSRNGRDDEEIEMPLHGNGWNYQAVEVGNLLRAGKLESSIMPLDETLAIMQTMDRIRALWNFKYPFET